MLSINRCWCNYNSINLSLCLFLCVCGCVSYFLRHLITRNRMKIEKKGVQIKEEEQEVGGKRRKRAVYWGASNRWDNGMELGCGAHVVLHTHTHIYFFKDLWYWSSCLSPQTLTEQSQFRAGCGQFNVTQVSSEFNERKRAISSEFIRIKSSEIPQPLTSSFTPIITIHTFCYQLPLEKCNTFALGRKCRLGYSASVSRAHISKYSQSLDVVLYCIVKRHAFQKMLWCIKKRFVICVPVKEEWL